MSLTFGEYYPEVKAEFRFEVDAVLFSEQSQFQKIEVVQSKGFGRMLLIDGFVMLTDRDEFVYHEMISHTPLFVHPNPKNVLVIGGGDGGTVRECLRHPNVSHVDLVDIDELVTKACVEFFPAIAGKLDDPRVSCFFEDGVAFVKRKSNAYDLIIVDSTDPISVGEGLFSREFYRDCFNALKSDGILVNQSESPAWLPKIVKNIQVKLRDIFPQFHFYHASIPTYPSGHWAFGFAAKTLHPLNNFDQQRYDQLNLDFNYYNDGIHRASFVLPTFFRKLLDE
ncbi:MAG: polyamine aminopropyltransferase [Calditrichia bacterium]